MSTASTISMNELYTANIALSVFAMAIMLFSLRGDISQSKIRNQQRVEARKAQQPVYHFPRAGMDNAAREQPD